VGTGLGEVQGKNLTLQDICDGSEYTETGATLPEVRCSREILRWKILDSSPLAVFYNDCDRSAVRGILSLDLVAFQHEKEHFAFGHNSARLS